MAGYERINRFVVWLSSTTVLDDGRRTRRLRAGVTISIAALITVLAAACGSATKQPNPGPKISLPGPIVATIPASLTGTWTGEWHHTAGAEGQGTLKMVWQRVGRLMRGTIAITGLACMENAEIQGSPSGSNIEFIAAANGQGTTYTGTYSADAMSGTYTTSCGNASGTWTMSKST